MNKVKIIIFSLLIIFISACSLSDKEKQEIKSVQSQIKLLNIKIDNQIKKIDSNHFFEKNKEKMKQDSLYKDKLSLINMKKSLLNKLNQLDFILKKDDDNQMNKVKLIKSDLNHFKITLSKIINSSNKRLSLFNKILKNPNYLLNLKKDFIKKLKNEEKILITISNNMKKKYSNRSSDIDKKLQPILKEIKIVYNKYDSLKKEKNILVKLSIFDFLNKKEKTIFQTIDLVKFNILSLDYSEVKILKDIKIDSFVDVALYSWDSYSDFNTDKEDLIRKIRINKSIADYINKNNVEKIATVPGFFKDYNCKTSENVCKNIVPKTHWKSLARSHGNDEGELWINNLINDYYFKYIIIKNDKKTETNWIKVSEDEFYKYYKSKGQTIYSKPYGYFIEEAIDTPSKVGSTLVGNPQYGEWKKDPNTGESFWSFYGKYMLFSNLIDMFTGHNYRYSHRDYNSWGNRYSYQSRRDSFRKRNGSIYSTGLFNRNKNRSGSSRYSFNRNKNSFKFKNSRSANSKFRARGPSGGGK